MKCPFCAGNVTAKQPWCPTCHTPIADIRGRLALAKQLEVSPEAYDDADLTALFAFGEYGDGWEIIEYYGLAEDVYLPTTYLGKPVVRVGDYAFDNAGIKRVVFASSYTSVGDGAFWHCDTLSAVEPNEGLQTIGKEAFCASGVRKIKLPDSLRSLGNAAFAYCWDMVSWDSGNGLDAVPDHALEGCDKLRSVRLGTGIAVIGEEAFSGCEALTGLTLPAGLTQLGKGAMRDCTALRSVRLPDCCLAVGEECWWGCIRLQSVRLGAGLADIGGDCFGYTDLLRIVLAKGNKIFTVCGGNLLRDDTLIVGVREGRIGDKVRRIAAMAWAGREGKWTLTIPADVQTVDANAVYDCNDMTVEYDAR